MDRKLRFLCLHGYLQNSEMFRGKMGSWRKGLKSRVEFVFIDAPHVAFDADNGTAAECGGRPGGKSWWLWTDTASTARPSKSAHYTGWEPSAVAIQLGLQEHWPVDGLLGFSQGATAIALFLAWVKTRGIELQLPPCAILVGGFLPRDPHFAKLVQDAKPAISALFMSGLKDTLVEPFRSEQLMSSFDPSAQLQIYHHDGAHMMPTCTGSVKQEVVDFLMSAIPKTQQNGAQEPQQ
ncbi:unnamed protein product [Ostreobium quekettii]|uniref:Serine hydrolase domain-containing protein n=1 Tax=Ostreobium quekettii TaxID=121088 RepID=A0A8S1J511_9CHLO|nr:unnamed protein product [Ostreobium quekettii]